MVVVEDLVVVVVVVRLLFQVKLLRVPAPTFSRLS